MEHEHEYRLEISPAVVDTHYAPNGSVAAALTWVELVLDGRLGAAWSRTSSLFRLSLARHWCWQQRAALAGDGHDPPLGAAARADEGPSHPLWPHFARSQRPPDSAGGRRTRWVAAGPPELVGPDLEVVQLVSEETAGTGHHAPPLTLLLRLSPAGWLVAGHGRTPVQSGWPPCRR